MLRKIGIAIAYLVTMVYIVSILLPAGYCFQHGCSGPGEGDAFMPAFLLTPAGGVGTIFALRNCIQNLRKESSSWVFFPLSVIFAAVLMGDAALIVWIVFETATHR